jgi:hypothetical protein
MHPSTANLPAGAPPQSVPYQYSRPHNALRSQGSAAQIAAAIEHFAFVAPQWVETPVPSVFKPGYAAMAAIGVVLAGLSLFGELPGALLPALALTIFGSVMLIRGLRGGVNRQRRAIDPSIAENISQDALRTMHTLVRGLVPALSAAPLQMEAAFEREIAKNAEGFSRWITMDLALTSALGVALRLQSTRFFRYTSTTYKTTRRTTTERYSETELALRPRALPSDIAHRIGAVSKDSFPTVTNAAATEVRVRDGSIVVVVRSRAELRPVEMAQFTNALARIAAMPSAVFDT